MQKISHDKQKKIDSMPLYYTFDFTSHMMVFVDYITSDVAKVIFKRCNQGFSNYLGIVIAMSLEYFQRESL